MEQCVTVSLVHQDPMMSDYDQSYVVLVVKLISPHGAVSVIGASGPIK